MNSGRIDLTKARLDDQIAWYGGRSERNQRFFKTFKILGMFSAGLVSTLSALAAPEWMPAALGVVILGAEGILQLNQYQQNWVSYRSTAEALKHEKYLHAASAGPYAKTTTPDALLAVRIESLISQEHRRWEQIEEESVQGTSGPR